MKEKPGFVPLLTVKSTGRYFIDIRLSLFMWAFKIRIYMRLFYISYC